MERLSVQEYIEFLEDKVNGLEAALELEQEGISTLPKEEQEEVKMYQGEALSAAINLLSTCPTSELLAAKEAISAFMALRSVMKNTFLDKISIASA